LTPKILNEHHAFDEWYVTNRFNHKHMQELWDGAKQAAHESAPSLPIAPEGGIDMTIEAVVRNHQEQLMRLPNVTAVCIGEREGKAVIKVYVTRKLPPFELRAEEVVPKALEGYEIDVEESSPITAQD
jgi:hypothetical protein